MLCDEERRWVTKMLVVCGRDTTLQGGLQQVAIRKDEAVPSG